MGMSIEEARTALGKERKYALHENKQAFDIAIDTMRKYQQLQADYESRLKADKIAILAKFVATCEQELSWVMYDTYGNETDVHKQFIDIFNLLSEQGDIE